MVPHVPLPSSSSSLQESSYVYQPVFVRVFCPAWRLLFPPAAWGFFLFSHWCLWCMWGTGCGFGCQDHICLLVICAQISGGVPAQDLFDVILVEVLGTFLRWFSSAVLLNSLHYIIFCYTHPAFALMEILTYTSKLLQYIEHTCYMTLHMHAIINYITPSFCIKKTFFNCHSS